MAPPARIGRYRVLGELGKGAMGTVYRALDEDLDRDVALKVMSEGLADADTRKRFLKEARAAAKLQHPNVVVIYELGEHEGAPYMVLEHLRGDDLQKAIEQGLKPDPRVKINLILQVLAGLARAHDQGIVHRDIKPSNIFLPLGNPAKIMDFGVARLAGHGQTTTSGVVVGTPNYMSPEQAKGGEIDGRSDLFSAGLILYELVTGERAFQANTVIAVVFKIIHEDADLSLIPIGPGWEKLHGVIARALQRDPARRYPDARAMSGELARALQDLGGSMDLTAPADQIFMVPPKPEPEPSLVAPPAAPATPPRQRRPATPAPRHPAPRSPRARPAPPARSPLPYVLAGALAAGALGLLGFAAWLVLGRGALPEGLGLTPPSSARSITAPEPAAPSAEPASPSPAAPTPRPEPSSIAPPTPPPTPAPTPAPTPPPTPAPTPTPPPAPATTRPAAPRANLTVEERLLRADDLLARGRFRAALAEAKAARELDPGNEDAQVIVEEAEAAIAIEDALEKARAALDAGDRDLAKREIRKGFAVNPNEGRLMRLWREATQ